MGALPFGRYRGVPFGQVPADYLEWVLANVDLDQGLEDAIDLELLDRYATCVDDPNEVERLRRENVELKAQVDDLLAHHGECYRPVRKKTDAPA